MDLYFVEYRKQPLMPFRRATEFPVPFEQARLSANHICAHNARKGIPCQAQVVPAT